MLVLLLHMTRARMCVRVCVCVCVHVCMCSALHIGHITSLFLFLVSMGPAVLSETSTST